MLRALAAVLVACAAFAAPFRPAPEEARFAEMLDRDHHPLEAREAAKAYLARHPDSWLACEVIGMVCLSTDGDLPRALYYFTRSRELLERAYGGAWGPGTPTGYYSSVLGFQASTQYRMERYQDALRTLDVHDRLFVKKRPVDHAWPLMKLGRDREARLKIDEAVAGGDPKDVANALNTLAAMEAESDRPEAAFATQMRIYDLEKAAGKDRDCTLIRNAADGAWHLGQTARAEQLLLEAADHFQAGTVTNPWGDLAGLYLEEQRLPEAMDAVKRMHQWAFHSRPLAAETHWSTRQILTGGLLLYCGATDEALAVARRVRERPDRHATGSARDGQREAGTQVFLYQALLDALARDGEELSYAPWKRRPGILARMAGHAVEAALARRRAGTLLMANPDRLGHSLRVLAPQAVAELPGGEVLLPRIAGPGVAEAEAGRLLGRTGPMAERERGFLLLALGAARLERGDARGALEALGAAEPALPAEYAVLHTQLLALRAKAQTLRGDRAGALVSLTGVLQRDGGELRRLGVSLPCHIQAVGPLAREAAGLLASSPRFTRDPAGFRVTVEAIAGGGLQGGLDSPQGTVLCRFQVPPGPDRDATVREFCRRFHHRAFGPRIDLSQQQIRSLEGSTLSAQSAEEQLKGILGN
ncbi:serine/threonine-protein kinase [Mesoterricola silvestris]|uniref:Tetratricopeptide repeat protein n=1 Tax=Mesoterricola silvestris TaxID=2927979 RepID=A0AA48KCX3_9BACT|nr:hypothetical protein [Mesoterricola silvestris]BDU73958.1 hypothetical protein METEAL_31320 [Mesoterricola silvestris]